MSRAILVFALLVFVSAPVLFAQQRRGATRPRPTPVPQSTKAPVEETDIILVETSLITTPVSVMDRNGRFISGLKKKDFKIFDNGVQQPVTYFQSEEMPFTVVLMIDISPSTRYRIDDIHYAAMTFVNQLRPTDKVMVVAFDSRIRILSEPTTDKKELYAAIYKANFGSGTSLYDAVDAITSLELVTSPGRKALVIFTDGVDTTSRNADYQSTIQSVEEVDALIYPIRYNTISGGALPNLGVDPSLLAQLPPAARELLARAGNRNVGRGGSYAEYERGKQYLETLATNSGGRIFEADTTANLEAAFAGVAEELRRRYSIGYYADAESTPGERRQIKIQVTRPGSVVRAKTSYIVRQKEKPAETPVSGN